jgi:hypothetical protein
MCTFWGFLRDKLGLILITLYAMSWQQMGMHGLAVLKRPQPVCALGA